MSIWFEGALVMDSAVALAAAAAMAYRHWKKGFRGMPLSDPRYPAGLRAFGGIVVAYWTGGLSVFTYAAYLDSGPKPPVFPLSLDLYVLFGAVVMNGVMVFWKRRADRSVGEASGPRDLRP